MSWRVSSSSSTTRTSGRSSGDSVRAPPFTTSGGGDGRKGESREGLGEGRAERHLDREVIAAGCAQRPEHVAQTDAFSSRLQSAAVLLPDQVEGTARLPLPPQHEVAAEGADIEVVVSQGERRCSVGDGQAAVGLARNRRSVRAVYPQLTGTRSRQLAEVTITTAGGKWFRVEVDVDVGFQRVSHPQLGRYRAAVDEREDVTLAECLRPAAGERGHILSRVGLANVGGGQRKLPPGPLAKRDAAVEVARSPTELIGRRRGGCGPDRLCGGSILERGGGGPTTGPAHQRPSAGERGAEDP